MTDFTTLDYLKTGNPKQKRAYDILTKHQIFEKLKKYSPVLAGTVPIGIDTEKSDLDVICQFKNEDDFAECLRQYFQGFNGFSLKTIAVNGEKSVVSNFILEEFPIEIFAQDKLPTKQNAYRHNTEYYRKKEKNLNRK